MKQRLLLLIAFFCLAAAGKSQKAYIQVNGEAGLSVYLNNTFQGKTTIELKGYIIENVPVGKNLIKIEKEGYAPFEEYVNVKAGEVFSYKVKPFSKHVVTISQEGRSGETEKKAEIKTGKLIVQSLPIEIKITIPQIDGVNNLAKTQDQWIANSLPEGSYTATFKYNDKTITKTIQVDGDNTTSVFINMLSGEFTTKRTLEERKAVQQALDAESAFVKEFSTRYKFKKWPTMDAFFDDQPAAKSLLSHAYKMDGSKTLILNDKQLRKLQKSFPGYTYISFDGTDVRATYTIVYTQDYNIAKKAYDNIETEFKNSVSNDLIYKWLTTGVSLYGVNCRISVAIIMEQKEGWYHTHLYFVVN